MKTWTMTNNLTREATKSCWNLGITSRQVRGWASGLWQPVYPSPKLDASPLAVPLLLQGVTRTLIPSYESWSLMNHDVLEEQLLYIVILIWKWQDASWQMEDMSLQGSCCHWLFQIGRIGYHRVPQNPILYHHVIICPIYIYKGIIFGASLYSGKKHMRRQRFQPGSLHSQPWSLAYSTPKQIPKKNNQNHEQVLHCFYNCSIFKYWCIMVYIYLYILYNIVCIIHLSSFVRPYYAYLV